MSIVARTGGHLRPLFPLTSRPLAHFTFNLRHSHSRAVDLMERVTSHTQILNKLAPYGTYGRLLLTANFKVT